MAECHEHVEPLLMFTLSSCESISFLVPFFLAVDISRQNPTLAATTSTGSEKGRVYASKLSGEDSHACNVCLV